MAVGRAGHDAILVNDLLRFDLPQGCRALLEQIHRILSSLIYCVPSGKSHSAATGCVSMANRLRIGDDRMDFFGFEPEDFCGDRRNR